jgi:hypothetical protein
MNKKLLLFILPIFLISASITAQNHTWDFSNSTIWPIAPSSTVSYSNDGLNIICGGSAMGEIKSAPFTFSDSYVSTNGMVAQGATGAPAPTKRAVSFPVTGPCTIKLWVSASSSGRIASISDGTNVLGTYSAVAPSPYVGIVTATYTGGVGVIYVYTTNTMNFNKLSVTYDPLSTDEFKNETATVFSDGNQIMVSNVKSNTTIAIYAITGALVKTIETNSDTNFSLNSGFFIAKVKSAEGEKSVKLFVK